MNLRTFLPKNTPITLCGESSTKEFVLDYVIGDGANCIVYAAHYIDSVGLKHLVRIKEFYPFAADISRDDLSLVWNDSAYKVISEESFRTSYAKQVEFQSLQNTSNSTVHVYDLCSGNNTLYIVMDIDYGKTFDNSN